MSSEKKQGVIILHKYRQLLEQLPSEEQGKILMAALLYDETGTVSEFDNPVTKMLFSVMKIDFDSMKDNWEKAKAEKSEAGKKGMANRWANNKKDYSITEDNKDNSVISVISDDNKDNLYDSVNVNDNDNVNDSVNNTPPNPPEGETGAKKLTKKDFGLMMDESDFSDNVKATLKNWLNYKWERNEPYKKTGFAGILSQVRDSIQRYGEQALIEVVNETIANGYKGITWDKIEKVSQQKQTKQSKASPTEYKSPEEVFGIE